MSFNEQRATNNEQALSPWGGWTDITAMNGPMAVAGALVGPPGGEVKRDWPPNMPISPAMLDGLLGYGPTRSGVQVNEQSALTFAAVYAATRLISNSMASMPIQLFLKEGPKKTLIESSQMAELLGENPNEEMNSFTLVSTMQGHLCLWGNAYGILQRDPAGEVEEIVPVHPRSVQVGRKNGRLFYLVDEEPYRAFDILHIKNYSMDGITGLSPISLAKESIALGLAAQIFGATFFGNGASVSGVLTHPGKMSPRALENLRESWGRMHTGVAAANRTAILEEGMKWEAISIPPEDAQFLQTRQFQIGDVARIFGVPPHMLGDLSRSTNNNIEQQSLEFLTFSLHPWITQWRQELSKKLQLRRNRTVVGFDNSHLVRPDAAARQGYYAAGRQWGYLNPNEIRAAEGLNPIPGGDAFLEPVNMVPLGSQQAQQAAPQHVPELKPGAAPANGQRTTNNEQQLGAAATGGVAAGGAATGRGDPSRRARDELLTQIPQINDGMDIGEQIFRGMAKYAMTHIARKERRALERAAAKPENEKLFLQWVGKFSNEIREQAQAELEDCVELAVERGFNIDPTLRSDLAVRAARAWADGFGNLAAGTRAENGSFAGWEERRIGQIGQILDEATTNNDQRTTNDGGAQRGGGGA